MSMDLLPQSLYSCEASVPCDDKYEFEKRRFRNLRPYSED